MLGISIFLFVRSKNKNSSAVDNTGNVTLPVESNNISGGTSLPVTNLENLKVPKLTTLEIQQKAVQNLAKIFVERLNSYSSESRYQNMLDVKMLATVDYWKQLNSKIPSSIPKSSPNFYAVSVEAYSAKLSAWTDSSASV
ncbi:MAG: hypothetical protein HY979_03355, partial [Candidatus Magasanikbacteria bacterium]|nr:hypothetical protein [Candidatus Magasanikbacteria bacterium]